MLCQRCNKAESTGFLVHLCDECFDLWEKELHASKVDIEPIDLALRTVKGGGLLPDGTKAVKITGTYDNMKITPVR